MKSIYSRSLSRMAYIRLFAVVVSVISMAGLFVSIAQAASVEPAVPSSGSGERLVTIFDQDKKQVFLTKAVSVREAVKQAGIELSPYDVVEPGLDTKFIATEYTVNIYRAHPIMIVDGMRITHVMSPHTSPKDIAKDAKVELHDEDLTTFTKPEDIVTSGGGLQMDIKRATPINLNLYGKMAVVYTQAKTVNELLDVKKIHLASDDTISVAKTAPLTANMTVEIWRNGVQTVTVDEPIAFPVRKIQDADHPVGYREVQMSGKNGKKSVTYEITMKNGQEVARKEIQSVALEQPSEQVEVVGAAMPPGSHTDWMAAAGISPSDYGFVNYIFTNESHWNPAAANYGGGYYGLGQTDKARLTGACGDTWASDPVCQIRVFDSYAKGRYGTWQEAAAFKRASGWW